MSAHHHSPSQSLLTAVSPNHFSLSLTAYSTFHRCVWQQTSHSFPRSSLDAVISPCPTCQEAQRGVELKKYRKCVESEDFVINAVFLSFFLSFWSWLLCFLIHVCVLDAGIQEGLKKGDGEQSEGKGKKTEGGGKHSAVLWGKEFRMKPECGALVGNLK